MRLSFQERRIGLLHAAAASITFDLIKGI